MAFAIFIIICLVILFFVVKEIVKQSKMSPEEREFYKEEIEANRRKTEEENRLKELGQCNPEIICPQCQTKGNVYTKQVKAKKGISGAKATGALLTGGVSILATGLSRKENLTEAYCNKCKTTWHF
jgi:hypothetical protein